MARLSEGERASGGFTETGRRPIFHYVISGHNWGSTTSSGISRGIGASDFLVTLGSFDNGIGSLAQQAGTFMHELGHNLGLRHGGGDNVNNKPNFLSIMNDSFQMSGIPRTGGGFVLDYSRHALATLAEDALDETLGLGPAAAGFDTYYYCSSWFLGTAKIKRALNASVTVDWDCDASPTGTSVSEDINKDGIFGASELQGFDDWSHLQLKAGAIGLPGALADSLPRETPEEILTPEMVEEFTPLPEGAGRVFGEGWIDADGTSHQFVLRFSQNDAREFARFDYRSNGARFEATAVFTVRVARPTWTRQKRGCEFRGRSRGYRPSDLHPTRTPRDRLGQLSVLTSS